MTINGLYATSNGSGSAGEQLPLDGVHVAVRIVNLVAEVQVVQFYVNDRDTSIDCVYAFPIDDNAAVCGLEVELKDRLLIGEVREKNQAREEYSRAISQGQTAALVEEDKPDIFEQRIGNIPPCSRVNVRITYVTELKVDKETGGAIFVLPTSVAPRYTPYNSSEPMPFATRWQDACFCRRLSYISGGRYTSVNDLPCSRWMHAIPTFVVDRERPAAFSFTLEAEMPSKVLSVESRTHQLSVVQNASLLNDYMSAASLFHENEAMGKDLEIIIYQEKPFEPCVQLEVLPDGSGCAMMTFVPEFETEPGQMEIVFVVDCSGSMSGFRIEAAKRALGFLVQSLPLSCAFNIIRFGSRYEALFHQPQTYSQTTLNEARSFIQKTFANMGGTEILRPLQVIVNSKMRRGASRQVFVLTDGQVSHTEEVLQLLRKNASNTRVFTVGIGDEVSRHLVEGMARATAGTAEFIVGSDLLGQGTGALDSKLINQLKLATLPSITKINVDWLGGATTPEPSVPEAPTSRFFPTGQGMRRPGSMMSTNSTTTVGASMHQVGSGQWFNVGPDASSAQPQGRNASLYQAPFLPPPLFSGYKYIMYCFFKPDEMVRASQVNVSALVPNGGDLFLAVPVTRVTSVGRTVHLLGARALVRDLTEGTSHLHFQKSFPRNANAVARSRPASYTYSPFSGWLNSSTTGTAPQDRATAWDLTPINPPYAIVRREIVEIGTQFGIVSKETSFVAVERWSDGRAGTADQPNPLPFENISVDKLRSTPATSGCFCNPPSPPASTTFSSNAQFSMAAAPSTTGGLEHLVSKKMVMRPPPNITKAARKATHTGESAWMGEKLCKDMKEKKQKKERQPRKEEAFRFADAREDKNDECDDDDLFNDECDAECERVSSAVLVARLSLHEMVMMQNFDGSIDVNDINAKTMGFANTRAIFSFEPYQDVRNTTRNETLASNIFFAIVFLAVLMQRFASDEDKWSLLATKTRAWLTTALVNNNNLSPFEANQLIEPWLIKTRQIV